MGGIYKIFNMIKNTIMNKNEQKMEKVINYLKSLDSETLSDILIEVGAFRSTESKSHIERSLDCDLSYEEYDNVDSVDIFVFPIK